MSINQFVVNNFDVKNTKRVRQIPAFLQKVGDLAATIEMSNYLSKKRHTLQYTFLN